MSLKNTYLTYGSVAKFLHWLIALAVIGLLCVGVIMIYLPDTSPWKFTLFDIHKLTGITVFFLMLIRIFWAIINVKPLLPLATKLWEKIAERFVHYSLYITLIAMPLSGWIMSTAAGYNPGIQDLFTLPFPGISKNESVAKFFAETHLILAWVIGVLVTIHVLAGLKHHFIDKDNVLRRMLPFIK